MRLGTLILPERRWPEARRQWQRAEALGFAHAWTYDHLAWGPLRDSPWFAAVPTLTAAALVTDHIRIGTLVASINFRHPVTFAKELMTLDEVSGGRLTLGIGAGSFGWDATVLGEPVWSPSERADRFAEFVELLDRLLREPVTTFRGRFYSADGARMHPGCVQQPRLPFAVAATGPRGMRLAASLGDLWVTTGARDHEGPPLDGEAGAALVREQMDRLDDACIGAGRDPGTLSRLVLAGLRLDGGLQSVEAFRDTVGRYADVGATDFVVHWPRPDGPYAADLTTFERIVAS